MVRSSCSTLWETGESGHGMCAGWHSVFWTIPCRTSKRSFASSLPGDRSLRSLDARAPPPAAFDYMLSSVSDVITDRNNLLQKIKRASLALIPYAHIKRAQDVLHLMLILVRCQNLFSRQRQHCFVVRSLRSPRSDSWLPIQISSHGTCFRPALSP